MKITIKHTAASIDPSATYSEADLDTVTANLEAEYEKALLAAYPTAAIEFIHEDCAGKSIIIENEIVDPSEFEDEIYDICETVFETGNFWI